MVTKKKPAGDQITTKLHNYVKNFAEDVQDKLYSKGYKLSEISIYDLMAKKLEERFEKVEWSNKKSVEKFVEEAMNAFEELKNSNDVKVDYRMRYPKK